jgi:hypothetical protein
MTIKKVSTETPAYMECVLKGLAETKIPIVATRLLLMRLLGACNKLARYALLSVGIKNVSCAGLDGTLDPQIGRGAKSGRQSRTILYTSFQTPPPCLHLIWQAILLPWEEATCPTSLFRKL